MNTPFQGEACEDNVQTFRSSSKSAAMLDTVEEIRRPLCMPVQRLMLTWPHEGRAQGNSSSGLVDDEVSQLVCLVVCFLPFWFLLPKERRGFFIEETKMGLSSKLKSVTASYWDTLLLHVLSKAFPYSIYWERIELQRITQEQWLHFGISELFSGN